MRAALLVLFFLVLVLIMTSGCTTYVKQEEPFIVTQQFDREITVVVRDVKFPSEIEFYCFR